jgi:hypothetical protein
MPIKSYYGTCPVYAAGLEVEWEFVDGGKLTKAGN